MKLILVLTIISVIAALLLGVTYNVTVDKIERQKELSSKEALKSVLPDAVNFSQKIKGREIEYYKGLDTDNNVTGYALMGEGRGYSSVISVMMGIDLQGGIKGIKILSQNETPGLGSKVEEVKSARTIWDLFKKKPGVREKLVEPWFQKQFKEKSIDKADIITGATITSKAVINIVKNTVEKFRKEES